MLCSVEAAFVARPMYCLVGERLVVVGHRGELVAKGHFDTVQAGAVPWLVAAEANIGLRCSNGGRRPSRIAHP